jgi:hypothetical protein
MRYLKTKVDEETRVKRVDSIVRGIYTQAVGAAEKGETSFNHPIPFDTTPQPRGIPEVAQALKKIASKKEAQFDAQMASYEAYKAANPGSPSDPFYLQNMNDILSGLRPLFPGCTISHCIMSKGTDGKMYDISTLDEKVLPFINRALDQWFIIIDWT